MMSCCLNSITDLRSVGFGQSVPEQGVWLLRWFASEIDIDINGDISLTFEPTGYDYGSHRYHNDEQLLDPLPRGHQYYSLGNVRQQGSLRLPHYVTHPQSEHEYGNRARIIIRVWEQNVGRRTSQRIDRVYITQHYETSEHQGTEYDPLHTYRVTTNLLRLIALVSFTRKAKLKGSYDCPHTNNSRLTKVSLLVDSFSLTHMILP
uniref:Uncharacterized protein n=1 Tax=Neolamprologus brichardi TaxID=32507 RepID=A0A3Q4GEH7_NEOBR